MNRSLLHIAFGCRVWNSRVKSQWIAPTLRILCCLALLSCLSSVCLAQDSLIGKWRALDETNIISGFTYLPVIKFSEDGNIYAGLTYGYRMIDDGKFAWLLGNGIEKIYKFQINDDILMIYSLESPKNRARFKRVR